jgi:hypothetical protein
VFFVHVHRFNSLNDPIMCLSSSWAVLGRKQIAGPRGGLGCVNYSHHGDSSNYK